MTNKEARCIINNTAFLDGKSGHEKTEEAIKTAISALETFDHITAERDAFMEDFKKGFEQQIRRGHGIYRCDICKYGGDYLNTDEVGEKCPKGCDGYNHWEWRGIDE